jgi:hypothetical protein
MIRVKKGKPNSRHENAASGPIEDREDCQHDGNRFDPIQDVAATRRHLDAAEGLAKNFRDSQGFILSTAGSGL